MPRINVGSNTLYIERHGEGFPVMMVSGLSGLAGYWEPQLKAFSREFGLVLHDHRGVGQSDHVGTRITVEKMAADVIALMDALEIKKAHIVGHSTGGAIAQVLALDYPTRVAAVVIAGSWSKPDAFFRRQFTLRRAILRGLGPEAYVQNNTVLHYPPAWITANNEHLVSYEAQVIANFAPIEIMSSRIDAILAFDRSKDLGRIKAPTLVVATGDDHVTPPHFSEAMARDIPNAELKLMPVGGHCFTQASAADFNKAVLPFLLAHTPQTAEQPAAAARD